MTRLQETYNKEIRSALQKELQLPHVMQVPRLEKVVLSMGVGMARDDKKHLSAAITDLTKISGQKPMTTAARKSIATFKLRKGMAIGCKVTLRHHRMYEFMDRLVNIALPRVRDFHGLSPQGFDGRGNFAFGIKEQLVFPEIDYDSIDRVRGFNVVIVTSAPDDDSARALLRYFHIPFMS